MLYDIDYAVAGLVFLIVLHIYILALYNKKNTSIRALHKIIVSLILADIFDIISAFTISFPHSIPLWFNYVLNIIFFELIVLCVYFLPNYINAILAPFTSAPKYWDRINNALLCVYALICISTPVTHWIFYFDQDLNYIHGKQYLLIFLFPLYLSLSSFIRLFKNKVFFTRRQFYSIIGFTFSAMISPAIQMLAPSNSIIDFFILSIAAFIGVIGLETPEFAKLEKALAELEKHKELLEKAKLREEERNKVTLEFTKSASWSLHMNENKEVTEFYWSDEFFWLLGYDREEVADQVNTLWGDSLHPDERDKILDLFTRGLQGIEPYDVQYRLKNKHGEYKWYRGTGELKILEDGKSSFYHGIIQDINEEKVRELLLRDKMQALEALEKSQNDLKEAVIKAESADKAKSDFLANMSHEIRTPLNAILGLNELIQRESSEDNIHTYSSGIADSGNTLLALINDVLDISKIEAGRMELVPIDYKLSDLVREVNNMIQIRCKEKGLNFFIQANPEIPNLLYGDQTRIRQILVNILNNALKYTDKGSVTLKLDYEKKTADKINLILSAIDTGIGIREEHLPLLFESFKRIDLKKNRTKEGTGLGLAITKSFVELMGGTIDVSSVYGEGSTFIIVIPQTVTGSEKIGELSTQNNANKRKKYQSSFTAPNARALLVDDVGINLKVLKGLLKPTLIGVDMANSGRECLEKIKETAYDIVLLDHMMPEMDGIETLDHIREDHTHPNQTTPVIMLTANAIIGAKEEYLKAGFADYLAKPVKPELLEEMLMKYLPSEKIVPAEME